MSTIEQVLESKGYTHSQKASLSDGILTAVNRRTTNSIIDNDTLRNLIGQAHNKRQTGSLLEILKEANLSRTLSLTDRESIYKDVCDLLKTIHTRSAAKPLDFDKLNKDIQTVRERLQTAKNSTAVQDRPLTLTPRVDVRVADEPIKPVIPPVTTKDPDKIKPGLMQMPVSEWLDSVIKGNWSVSLALSNNAGGRSGSLGADVTVKKGPIGFELAYEPQGRQPSIGNINRFEMIGVKADFFNIPTRIGNVQISGRAGYIITNNYESCAAKNGWDHDCDTMAIRYGADRQPPASTDGGAYLGAEVKVFPGNNNWFIGGNLTYYNYHEMDANRGFGGTVSGRAFVGWQF